MANGVNRSLPYIGLLCAALLGGCATLPPVSTPSAILRPGERAQVLAGLHAWQAEGQVAIAWRERTEQVGFTWTQTDSGERVSFRDPLGRTVARLTASPYGASLETADGHSFQAGSLTPLLARVLPVPVPAEAVPHWLLALPGGDTQVTDDDRGLPARLSHGGWQVHYLAYQAVGGLEMPRLIQVQGPDGISLRLAITRWRFGEAGTP